MLGKLAHVLYRLIQTHGDHNAVNGQSACMGLSCGVLERLGEYSRGAFKKGDVVTLLQVFQYFPRAPLLRVFDVPTLTDSAHVAWIPECVQFEEIIEHNRTRIIHDPPDFLKTAAAADYVSPVSAVCMSQPQAHLISLEQSARREWPR